MGDTIYRCDSGSITAFPLSLSTQPTIEHYKRGIDALEGLIDFQWAPIASGLTTSPSTTGSIYLQTVDTASTVVYNTVTYSIVNVQITRAQHTSWLISNSTINTEDLVIVLKANTSEKYLLFVLPLLTNGSPVTDPAYLKNINTQGSGTGIESCFSQITPAPLFAHYITCIDGYTEHARTQNIGVFVCTVGLPVSPATMAAIKKDSISPSVIELPQIIANKYYNASAGSGPSRLTASPTGITIISPQDFHLYITTTTFTKSSMTNIGNQLQTRTDSTNAYQCVELDPDEVDSNKNIHIDLQTGNISGTVLKDILEERAILKEMVNPGADPAALKTKAQAQEASAIILVLIIILGTIGGLYWFIFREDQNATVIKQTNRFFAEMGLSVVIGILLFAAAVMRIVSKDTAMHTNSYIVGGVGLGMAFLFFLWFFVLFPQLTKTECGRAAIDLARGATGASVATGTGTAVANPVTPAPTTLSFLQPYINNGVQMGIVAAIFTFVGFIVGNII